MALAAVSVAALARHTGDMNPISLLRVSSGPVRSRLIRDLVLLILFTVGLLVAINIPFINIIKENLAESRIDGATTLVRDEVRALVLPVEQQLLIIRDGLASAGLTPRDEQELTQRLVPIMARMTQIAGAVDASADGADYFIRRDGAGWLTQIGDAEPARRLAEGLLHFHSSGVEWWGGFRPLTEDLSSAWSGVALPVSETLWIGGR